MKDQKFLMYVRNLNFLSDPVNSLLGIIIWYSQQNFWKIQPPLNFDFWLENIKGTWTHLEISLSDFTKELLESKTRIDL